MYTSDIEKSLRTGMIYLAVSLVVAAAGAIYGLFSHGVYSYYMTYAFMIPLLAGAMPHLISAWNQARGVLQGSSEVQLESDNGQQESSNGLIALGKNLSGDAQIAVIAALTTGSLMKGVLDIYGTTNRLLIAYPFIAAAAIAASVLIAKKGITKKPVYLLESPKDESGNYAYEDPGNDTAEQQNREIKEYTQFLDQGSCDE